MVSDYDQFRLRIFKEKGKKPVSASGKIAVSSVSREATFFAIDVMKKGGNAFDAAFALALSLTIYHPQAGNIGGGGYLLYKLKGASKPSVLNYREMAPKAVKIKHFLDENGHVKPDLTAFGPRSICVPGTLKAFFNIQKRYGNLRAGDILRELSKRAREGGRITAYEAQCLNRLREKLSFSPESRSIYVKEHGLFKEGDSLPNPNLAKTLEIMADEDERAFYEGRIAEMIERDITDNGGFLTVEDLKNYELREQEPICTEFSGYKVWTVPPEGGGAILIEILNILNRKEFLRLKPFTPLFYHFLAQACKIAFIDRMYYLGDINLESNMVYSDIFKNLAMERAFNHIDGNRDIATGILLERLHGQSFSELCRSEGTGDEPAGGEGIRNMFPGSSETTHFSIIDGEGNAVSNSYTLNLRYGSKWSVRGCGFLLNGSIDSFSFHPGEPNYFGLPGNRVNLLAQGKRPASNMCPVMVTRDEDVEMLLGCPGGPAIPATLSMIILSVLGAGVDPVIAVEEARIHHQGWPDVLFREDDEILMERLRTLEEMGYRVEKKNEPIGDVHAVFKRGDGYLAVSDNRREGYSAAI
ncbi:MAG: gamma-glutamyltransferase [Spirochaetota bacterium]